MYTCGMGINFACVSTFYVLYFRTVGQYAVFLFLILLQCSEKFYSENKTAN